MAADLTSLIDGVLAAIRFVKNFVTTMVIEGCQDAKQALEQKWPEPPNVTYQTGGPVKTIEITQVSDQQAGAPLGTVARHAHASRRATPSRTVPVPSRATVAGVRKLGERLVTLINDPGASKSGVCPVCEALEGMTFTLEEFNELVPLHPHCKCKWVPLVGGPGDRKAAVDMDDAGDTVIKKIEARAPELWEGFINEWKRG